MHAEIMRSFLLLCLGALVCLNGVVAQDDAPAGKCNELAMEVWSNEVRCKPTCEVSLPPTAHAMQPVGQLSNYAVPTLQDPEPDCTGAAKPGCMCPTQYPIW